LEVKAHAAFKNAGRRNGRVAGDKAIGNTNTILDYTNKKLNYFIIQFQAFAEVYAGPFAAEKFLSLMSWVASGTYC
jgi:hypothetical protein